jgi:hypothetical protein
MSADEARPAELFQLDRATCLALLGVQHIGRLVIPGDDPYVIPVNYLDAGEAIVVRTQRRPVIGDSIGKRVVFEVDMYDERTKSGWSVVVRGVAEDITPVTDLDAVPGAEPLPWAPGERACVVRITADHVTGRLLRGAVTRPAQDQRGYL